MGSGVLVVSGRRKVMVTLTTCGYNSLDADFRFHEIIARGRGCGALYPGLRGAEVELIF